MVQYKVTFLAGAYDDILESYEWGVSNWGEELAQKWLEDLYDTVYGVLEISPLGCPIAPDNEKWDFEVRMLVFLRYRILFTVLRDQGEVVVVRISGPYTGRVAD